MKRKDKQKCFQTTLLVFVVELETLLYFSFFILSFWIMGRLSESINDFKMETKNNGGIKENDIFLGVYFLLPNKVLKSIWVDMWKNCVCLHSSWMNSSVQIAVRIVMVGDITKGDSPCRRWLWVSPSGNHQTSQQMSNFSHCHLLRSFKSVQRENSRAFTSPFVEAK